MSECDVLKLFEMTLEQRNILTLKFHIHSHNIVFEDKNSIDSYSSKGFVYTGWSFPQFCHFKLKFLAGAGFFIEQNLFYFHTFIQVTCDKKQNCKFQNGW